MDKRRRISELAQTFQKLLEELYSGPIRVVIARDRDVEVVVTTDDVGVFADTNKTTEVATLGRGRAIRFTIVGWPTVNVKHQVMVPILWQGETCYVDARWFQEV